MTSALQHALRVSGAIALSVLLSDRLCRPAIAQCTRWELATSEGPPERHYSAMAYDSARGVTVLFGGRACCPWSEYGDTWEWDGVAWSLVATDGPSPRYLHVMAYDSARGVTVLFSGYPSDGSTWEWNGNEWTQVATEGPPSEYGGAMAYDEARGECVLFTGAWQSTAETWTWDGQTWTLANRDGPSRRLHAAMAYDAARQRIVLSGGNITSAPIDETWEWDGASWTLVNTGGIPPRKSHSLVYDPARGVTLLTGGFSETSRYNYDYDQTTWQWDGIAWTKLADTIAWGEFDSFAMDPLGRILACSGWGTATETRACAPELWIRRCPETIVEELGSRAEFTVIAGGSGLFTYQWYLDDQPLSDTGPFSGSRSASLAIDPIGPGTVGAYTVEVAASCGSVRSGAAHLIVVNPHIDVFSDCAGRQEVAVVWREATPRAPMHLLYAQREGDSRVPRLLPCARTPLGLDPSTIRHVYSGLSDFGGRGLVHGSVNPSACSGYLQLIDQTTCRTSNVDPIE